MAKLVILSEGLTGKTHELSVEKTSIGRVDDNIFPIPESSVSSHHCEILLRGIEVIVRDLNSTNGTFINGHQVTGEAPLKAGQILRLGQIEMRLEDENSAKSVAPKKLPDQTMVIPQGVKLGEPSTTPINFEKSTFAKKSNMAHKVFIGVIIVIAVAVGVLLMVMLKKTSS